MFLQLSSSVRTSRLVRLKGLEPLRLAAHGPQPCASASSAMTARISLGFFLHGCKKSCAISLVFYHICGTGDRGRTDTMLPSPDFESGASANSATPAQRMIYYHTAVAMCKKKLMEWGGDFGYNIPVYVFGQHGCAQFSLRE